MSRQSSATVGSPRGPSARSSPEFVLPGLVRFLPGMPRDGPRLVEHLDPVGHLVVLVRVVLVEHRHSKHLASGGYATTVQGLADPAGAVDVGVGRRVSQYREHRFPNWANVLLGLKGVVEDAAST